MTGEEVVSCENVLPVNGVTEGAELLGPVVEAEDEVACEVCGVPPVIGIVTGEELVICDTVTSEVDVEGEVVPSELKEDEVTVVDSDELVTGAEVLPVNTGTEEIIVEAVEASTEVVTCEVVPVITEVGADV